jgi:hypothetical protein
MINAHCTVVENSPITLGLSRFGQLKICSDLSKNHWYLLLIEMCSTGYPILLNVYLEKVQKTRHSKDRGTVGR